MSLLMKALKKAEQKLGGGPPDEPHGTDYGLEPLEGQPASQADPYSENKGTVQKTPAAATVLEAKRAPTSPSNRQILMGLGSLALLIAIGYGGYVYYTVSAPVTVPPQSGPIATNGQPPLPGPLPLEAQLPVTSSASAPEKNEPRTLPAENTNPTPNDQPGETVKVSTAPTAIAVNPQLMSAYQELRAGHLESAQAAYLQVLHSEPKSIDALLGLAVIAAQQRQVEQASHYYFQALEQDPQNAIAQAGLIGLLGPADPQASESRLKQLLATRPSAFLYFALGNLCSQQTRWNDAEQAYFEAYRLQPDNPDYAFNLAVSLDQLSQQNSALNYYLMAQQLSQNQAAVNFNKTQLAARISELQQPPK